MTRSLLLLSLLPLSALAQIQVFQFDGANEIPIGAAGVDIGTTTPGDSLTARFRVRNIGSQGAVLQQPIVGIDKAFTVSALFPKTPYILAPGAPVDFSITLVASAVKTYSTVVTVSSCQDPADSCPRYSVSFPIQATSVATAALTLAGSNAPLAAGAVIDFGSVLRGKSHSLSFTLTNPGAANLTVGTVAVSGAGFSGPTGISAPIQLAPGQSASFQVAFEPQNGQPAQGTLIVDRRSFNLKGQGLDPLLPGASIVLSSSVGASAQQNSVSIPLASASQVDGTGTLTMTFQSGVAGVTDDPAIQFLSGAKRTATVSIKALDSAAKIGGQSSLAFQTGATAGTIVFTLTLPNGTQQTSQTSLTIPPAPFSLDNTTSTRKVGELDVSVSGLDNTYSASQLAFTFYNAKGAMVQPGVIRVDATADFKQYFATSPVGGMFELLARFPVTGDTSQIVSVDVQITSSAGVFTAPRIPF